VKDLEFREGCGFLLFAEFQKVPHSLWRWGVQSAQEFKIAALSIVRDIGSVELHPLVDLIRAV